MASILIPTIPDDLHAAAVAHVLERMGHQPIRWFCSDFPQQCTISMSPQDRAETSPCVVEGRGGLPFTQADIFWNRRIAQPTISSELQEGDQRFAMRESSVLLAGALELLSQRSFSVNGLHEAVRAENKVLQLAVARELGFSLPETLVSNDPVRIRRFVREWALAGTIYKSFRPATWKSNDGLAALCTAKVDEAMLPADAMLQLGPGIFQTYVPKAYELRVTCMGDEVIAARLDSQATQDGKVDWRNTDVRHLSITRVELPTPVQTLCRALLRRLGLVFGCIDLIVTPDGEYVFLEINQMGQFLWIEDACPEIPMLQIFCEFLLSRDPRFRPAKGSPRRYALAEVRPDAVSVLQEDNARYARPRQDAHLLPE